MRVAAPVAACLLLVAALAPGIALADPLAAAVTRIEARSADYYLVGVVHGDTLDIHVSRGLDNTPVRDATLSVVFRGAAHPAVAQVDGGYTLKSPELALPGTTALEFDLSSGGTEQKLSGVLDVARPTAKADEDLSGNVRQIAWWILNFAVCGAFLVLWSRRGNKNADED